MNWFILIGIVLAYICTVRMATRAMYLSNRRNRYMDNGRSSEYDNSSYETRDAPHFDDWMIGACVAIGFPITLPILLGMKWHGAFDGTAEDRWNEKQMDLREQQAENRRLQKIVDELGGVPDVG